MTDKEVLATTKASNVNTKGVQMWAEDKSPVEFYNTTAKLFEYFLCRSFSPMVHHVWQHGEYASHSISNQRTNPRTAVMRLYQFVQDSISLEMWLQPKHSNKFLECFL